MKLIHIPCFLFLCVGCKHKLTSSSPASTPSISKKINKCESFLAYFKKGDIDESAFNSCMANGLRSKEISAGEAVELYDLLKDKMFLTDANTQLIAILLYQDKKFSLLRDFLTNVLIRNPNVNTSFLSFALFQNFLHLELYSYAKAMVNKLDHPRDELRLRVALAQGAKEDLISIVSRLEKQPFSESKLYLLHEAAKALGRRVDARRYSEDFGQKTFNRVNPFLAVVINP